jgi:hypothetical protein
VWYVDHQSLWVDVKILVMTMWHVFKREGISHPGEATMTEFLGYHPNLSGIEAFQQAFRGLRVEH